MRNNLNLSENLIARIHEKHYTDFSLDTLAKNHIERFFQTVESLLVKFNLFCLDDLKYVKRQTIECSGSSYEPQFRSMRSKLGEAKEFKIPRDIMQLAKGSTKEIAFRKHFLRTVESFINIMKEHIERNNLKIDWEGFLSPILSINVKEL